MPALHLLAYYVFAFLQEDALCRSLREGGLRRVWSKTRLLSAEFCLLYYPWILYFWCVWLPDAAQEIRELCRRLDHCSYYLSYKRAWLTWTADTSERPYVDNADIQWREFRASLKILLPVAACLVLLVRVVAGRCPSRLPSGYVSGALTRLVLGLLFLVYVHGAGAVFPLLIAVMFFCLGRCLAGSRCAVPLAWLLMLLCIVAKDDRLPLRQCITFGRLLGPGASFLDRKEFQGAYGWPNSVNLMLLRLVSFVLDWHRAMLAVEGSASGPVRERYTLVHCLSHAFYMPTFVAGPTIGFDDFMDQCAQARPSVTHLGWYTFQLGGALFMLETGTHLYPLFAVARSGTLNDLPPRLGAAAVFLTLNLMWLKFLCIWRVGRAWALAEGIDVPENMQRSMCNHYSVVGFWRCWHTSFNRWLVRYLYVPLGGRSNRMAAALLTFLFVSLWHDLEAKLLAWGLLNAAILALESFLGSAWQRKSKGLATARPWLHRQLGALGGTTYIISLMGMNMIGYSVGVRGISHLLAQAQRLYEEALWVLAGAYVVLFCGVQVMIELRQLDGTATVPAKQD